MANSLYLAAGAVAAAVLATGDFVCAKLLTTYFTRRTQRLQVTGFVKHIFGHKQRVQRLLDKLSEQHVANLLRVRHKLRSLKDSARQYAGSARTQGLADLHRLLADYSRTAFTTVLKLQDSKKLRHWTNFLVGGSFKWLQ